MASEDRILSARINAYVDVARAGAALTWAVRGKDALEHLVSAAEVARLFAPEAVGAALTNVVSSAERLIKVVAANAIDSGTVKETEGAFNNQVSAARTAMRVDLVWVDPSRDHVCRCRLRSAVTMTAGPAAGARPGRC